MSIFNQYPYINLNDLNLDFILNAIKEMRNEVTNFVSINAIKYADPIQWSITSQYEKNTIVIDPVTGTAYISVAPVPAGVALTRPEYWTVVFDLQSFVTKANQNLANNYEEQTTTTATMNTSAGQWIIWGDVLYKALVNITAGDAYVVGSNIEHITIEEVIDAIVNNIATEVQARIDGDSALSDRIDDEVQARIDGDSALSDRINDEVQARIDGDSALSDRIDDEVQARTDADDALTARIDTLESNVGDLDDLTTTDKSSLVNAINEMNEHLGETPFINVKDYGAVGDGVTDDTQAIQSVLDMVGISGGTIIFPTGDYYVTNTLTVQSNTHILGVGHAKIMCRGTNIVNPNSAPQTKVGLYFAGSYTDEMNATQGAMSGYTITVNDGTRFNVGDMIEIYSTTSRFNYESLSDGPYTGYLAIVEAVNGNVITIDHNPYTNTPNAKIRKIDPVHDISISNMIFEGFDVADTQQHGIWFKYGYNILIEHCEFIGFDWYTIGAVSSVNTRILNNNITGTYYDGYTGMIFFGIAALNDNYKMIVSGNTGRKIRHLFVNSGYTPIDWAVGAPCKITVENNIMIGADSQGDGASYAFQHHGFGLDILFDGNIADGCFAGFHVEGTGVTISNNIITNYLVNAISVGYGYEIQDVAIIGNRIRNYIGADRFTDQVKSAIYIDGTVTTSLRNVKVSNNLIELASSDIYGIRANGNIDNLTINGNTIARDTASGFQAIFCNCNNYHNSIKGNTILGANQGIYASGVYDISGNTVDAAGASSGICIYLDGAGYAGLVGNTVFGYQGLQVNSNNNKIVGNMISPTNNVISGTGNIGVGNYPTSLNT